MFDGEQPAGTQPPPGVGDNGDYHRHAIWSAKHRMMGIMLGYFRFQKSTVRNVGWIRHHQIDPSVEFGKQVRSGDVGVHEFDRAALGVAARILQRSERVVDANDPGRGPVLGQCYRQRAGSGAHIDNDRPRRKVLCGGPRQDGFGLRSWDENTGADVQHHRPERHRPDEVLQRHPLRARRNDVAIASEELFAGRLDQCQPATVGACQVRGQLLGIAARRVDPGFGEKLRSRVDCAPQSGHACCSLDCLSAAPSASNSASRSPSST